VWRLLKEQKEGENLCKPTSQNVFRSNPKAGFSIQTIKGIQVLATRVEVKDPKALREMADRLKIKFVPELSFWVLKGMGKPSSFVP